MSARRPSQEETDQLFEQERERLRKIGIRAIVIAVVVTIGLFIALSARHGGDGRDTVLVTTGKIDRPDLERDQFVRVRGTVRNALDDDRFDDLDRTNAIDADEVRIIATPEGTGLTDLDKITDNSDLRGQQVTVVGQVVDTTIGNIFTIADPKD